MKERLLNVGNLIGAVCFSIVFIIFFFVNTGSYLIVAQLVTLPVALFLLVLLVRLIDKKAVQRFFDIPPYKLYLFCALFMFAIQMILVIGINFMPRTDASHMHKICMNYITGKNQLYQGLDLYHQNYLDRYSNQWGIFLIQSFIYKISYALTGRISISLLPFLNVLVMQLSYFLTYKISGLVFNERRQKPLSVIILAACPVLYVYSCVFYTDTLGMPFLLGAIYFGLKAKRATNNKVIVYTIVSALCIALGFVIKGNVAIVAVAFLIYMFLRMSLKRFMAFLLAVVISFVSVNTAVEATMKGLGIVTDESIEKYSFPYTHWVMMGLNGRGGYNADDFQLTFHTDGLEAKKQMNKDEIKSRISEMGFAGMLSHLALKIRYTWYGGAYQSTNQFALSEKSSLTDFFSSSGVYLTWCFLFQAMLIILMLISFWAGVIRKRLDSVCLLRLMQLGMFLFLLMWETRSRYMLNLLPIYILITADGAWELKVFLDYISQKKMKKTKTVD